MDIKIDFERLKKLEDIEQKMLCLESAGVDNWEGYDIALDSYRQKKEKEEKLSIAFQEILEILCEGVEEPAGRGCGFGFREEEQELAFTRFKEIIQTFQSNLKG